MGPYLSTHRLSHGEQGELARQLGVSSRTLRSWKSRAGASGPSGRPSHGADLRAVARVEVERVWSELAPGHDGWRSVLASLKRHAVSVPRRLVEVCVRELKSERASQEHERIAKNRVHVEVLVSDALWALDQTHLGRDVHGAVQALVVRECSVPLMLAASVGPPACGQDVVRLLEHAASKRGTWPHVLMLDNGGENRNEVLEERLRREHVIVLWNEPRTPQHNARIERTIGSLKRASGLDEAARAEAEPTKSRVSSVEPRVSATRTMICARLAHAWHKLDHETPRLGLGARTPAEVDSQTPRAEDCVGRARFYGDVCEELERCLLAEETQRARRKRRRETIWNALQRTGMVKRTRGGRHIPTVKAEGVS